jgi:hypothetical protein
MYVFVGYKPIIDTMATIYTTCFSTKINKIFRMRISRLCNILTITIFPNSVNRLVFVVRHCAFYVRYERTSKELFGLKGLISFEKNAHLLRRLHLTDKYHEELGTLGFHLSNVSVRCSL